MMQRLQRVLSRRWRVSCVALACFVAFGCGGGEPTGGDSATPGALRVMLTSPNPTDQALLVQLVGDSISNVVVSGTGRTAYVRAVTPTRSVVVIMGPVASGELLRFDVPDTRNRTEYIATVLEAADATNALRASTSGYALQVLR
jgi:hypothetical protein